MSHDDTTRLDRWISAARSGAAKKAYTLASLVFALAAGGYALRPNARYLPNAEITALLAGGAVFYTALRAWAGGAHREIPRIARSLLSVGRGVTNRLSAVERQHIAAGAFGVMLVLSSIGGVAGPFSSSAPAQAAAGDSIWLESESGDTPFKSFVVMGNGDIIGQYTNRKIVRLNSSDGSREWTYTAESGYSLNELAVTEDGTVTTAGSVGVLGLDAATGNQVYKKAHGGSSGSVAQFRAGTLYVTQSSEIEKYDADTGVLSGTIATNELMVDIAIDESGTVYGSNLDNYNLVAYSDSGTKVLDVAIDSHQGLIQAPVSVNDGTVYAPTGVGVSALDASSGDYKWNYSVGVTGTTPTIHNGNLFAGSGTTFFSLDASSGSEQWTKTLSSDYKGGASPTVAGGRLYIAGQSNQYVVDPSDGSEYYTVPGGATKTHPVVADGRLYTRTSGYEVIEVSHTQASKDSITKDKQRSYGLGVGIFGQTVSGTVTTDGSGVDTASVTITNTTTGNTLGTATTSSDGTYSIGGISSGEIKVEASTSGYQTASKTVTITDSPRTVDLSLAKEGTYKQAVILDDDTGKFSDDPRLQVWKYTGDRTTPLGGPFTLPSNWRQVSQSSFNWQNLTTPRLKDGKLYSFTVTDGADVIAGVPPSPLYEYVGFRANKSADTLYLRIRDQSATNETVAANTDDGVAVTHETNGTDLTNLTYEIPGGANTDGPAFEGGVPDFGDPGGDYQSVIGDDILENISDRTDSGTVDEIEYEGGYSSGETFNGTTGVLDSFPGFTSNSSGGGAFGPVSGGGGGGTTTGQTIAGIGILAAGGYLAYRRWGNGNINVPVIGK